ncbi:mechanosensitive ion channel family protein [Acidithrix sp. C25]|uniref:mechanosensitive ion channel family protein n=1 Tax=Acidithrix sp. C25 TaxID=1671482 RepID=UPI00191BBB76|nr:mechanosensitive ion channel family protein [Acidithrix sp. C25]
MSGITEAIGIWVRDVGLVVALMVIGSVLAARSVHFVGTKVSSYLKRVASQQIRDEFVLSERNKYVSAVVQAVDWAAVAIIYSVSLILVLIQLRVPITSLVAPATVIGVALGFGAQTVVQDLLAGFFIFAERQYGVGDIIRISAPGVLAGITGTVEEVTLRITRIRNLSGEQIILPNSEIRQVVNLSREWSQVVVDFPIRQDVDLAMVRRELENLATSITQDPRWVNVLVGPLVVTGIETISPGMVTIRILGRTLPAQQWEVGREIRMRGITLLGQSGALFNPDSVNYNFGP